MYYINMKVAQQCEDFCKKHKSCNIDIIKHAVKIENRITNNRLAN